MSVIKDERERLERDKKDITEQKTQLERYNEDLHKRDLDLEQTAIRVARIKRDGELALHEAKFLDEEHKTRVAKFNAFLEQLREKELSLIRQAVTADPNNALQARSAVQLSPGGSLTVVPRRTSSTVVDGRAAAVQLMPNPARVDLGRYWQGEREYLQVSAIFISNLN